MRNFMKKTGIIAVLFSLIVSLFPVTTYAGGIGAAIEVYYVVVDAYGSENIVYDSTSTPWAEYKAPLSESLSHTVEGPEGTGYTEKDNSNSYAYYIKPTAGTYTLTSYDIPDGYVLDEDVLAAYPLSVTVTEQDVQYYKDQEKAEDYAGTIEYKIYIPIKKTGTKSLLLSKPAKVKITSEVSGKNTVLRFSGNYMISRESLGNIKYEIQYSTKKTGTYKKLCAKTTDTYINLSSYKKLKNKKTYYFKVRAIKTVNGKKKTTINGAWSSPKKVTVKK